MSMNYPIISFSLQVQPVFVNGFLAHFTVQDTRLHELTTRAKLLHGFRLIELLLELLECALDVVALFDLNAQHDFLYWAPKIQKLRAKPNQSLSNSRPMTSF